MDVFIAGVFHLLEFILLDWINFIKRKGVIIFVYGGGSGNGGNVFEVGEGKTVSLLSIVLIILNFTRK